MYNPTALSLKCERQVSSHIDLSSERIATVPHRLPCAERPNGEVTLVGYTEIG